MTLSLKYSTSFAALLVLTCVSAYSAAAQTGDVPPWKRPMPCVERIPARTLPDMPPWKRDRPAQVLGSSSCDDVKSRAFGDGATCVCIDQSGIDARSGCCSHHHGVCGCKDRTIMCCDGSASPTCTCHE
jgi:hypothetical protein